MTAVEHDAPGRVGHPHVKEARETGPSRNRRRRERACRRVHAIAEDVVRQDGVVVRRPGELYLEGAADRRDVDPHIEERASLSPSTSERHVRLGGEEPERRRRRRLSARGREPDHGESGGKDKPDDFLRAAAHVPHVNDLHDGTVITGSSTRIERAATSDSTRCSRVPRNGRFPPASRAGQPRLEPLGSAAQQRTGRRPPGAGIVRGGLP